MKNIVIKNLTKLFLIKILFGNRRHFMLKRKAMHYIKKWVDSKNKKCLVIQGARQTGKTYIVERFAEENYEEIVEINFKQIPSAMDIFFGDLKVDDMVMAMSVFDNGKCKSIR